MGKKKGTVSLGFIACFMVLVFSGETAAAFDLSDYTGRVSSASSSMSAYRQSYSRPVISDVVTSYESTSAKEYIATHTTAVIPAGELITAAAQQRGAGSVASAFSAGTGSEETPEGTGTFSDDEQVGAAAFGQDIEEKISAADMAAAGLREQVVEKISAGENAIAEMRGGVVDRAAESDEAVASFLQAQVSSLSESGEDISGTVDDEQENTTGEDTREGEDVVLHAAPQAYETAEELFAARAEQDVVAFNSTSLNGRIHVILKPEAWINVENVSQLQAIVTIVDGDGTVVVRDQNWVLDPSMIDEAGNGIDIALAPELDGYQVTMRFYTVDAQGEVDPVGGNAVTFDVDAPEFFQTGIPRVVSQEVNSDGDLVVQFDPDEDPVDRSDLQSVIARITYTDDNGDFITESITLPRYVISEDGRSAVLPYTATTQSIELVGITTAGGLTYSRTIEVGLQEESDSSSQSYTAGGGSSSAAQTGLPAEYSPEQALYVQAAGRYSELQDSLEAQGYSEEEIAGITSAIDEYNRTVNQAYDDLDEATSGDTHPKTNYSGYLKAVKARRAYPEQVEQAQTVLIAALAGYGLDDAASEVFSSTVNDPSSSGISTFDDDGQLLSEMIVASDTVLEAQELCVSADVGLPGEEDIAAYGETTAQVVTASRFGGTDEQRQALADWVNAIEEFEKTRSMCMAYTEAGFSTTTAFTPLVMSKYGEMMAAQEIVQDLFGASAWEMKQLQLQFAAETPVEDESIWDDERLSLSSYNASTYCVSSPQFIDYNASYENDPYYTEYYLENVDASGFLATLDRMIEYRMSISDPYTVDEIESVYYSLYSDTRGQAPSAEQVQQLRVMYGISVISQPGYLSDDDFTSCPAPDLYDLTSLSDETGSNGQDITLYISNDGETVYYTVNGVDWYSALTIREEGSVSLTKVSF